MSPPTGGYKQLRIVLNSFKDKAVSVIAAGCNSLLSLDLSSCGISDVALRYLSMHCVFLETLKSVVKLRDLCAHLIKIGIL